MVFNMFFMQNNTINVSIDVQLKIETRESELVAHLLFSNNSSGKIFLDTWTICSDDVFRREIFSITDENNNEVPYSGMMVKRDVLPEDFIVLNNGDKIETSITLNRGYKLIKGKKYIIQYQAFIPTFLKEQLLMEMQSNKVEVVY
jgi:hypothetical protein